MSYTSFTITQPFLGAPLQFSPPLGSVEFELLVDCYVPGSACKQDKLSQVTIDFYNTATVDLNNGALVKTYNVFPAWMAPSPTQSQSSGFTPSPASSANFQSGLGDSAYASSRSGTASGRVAKKVKRDVSVSKKTEARLPGFSIMTKDGIDVTSSAGRGTKTKEQREHAHLIRQLKACADCKRKKVRCDPSHRRSHNEMSRASTSNASSASDRISPAASTPSVQDTGSFDTANTFHDLSFFSDDFTLFPDDAAFFQDGMDMAMWDTVAPSIKEYMATNLSNFNFDTSSSSSSHQVTPRLAQSQTSSQNSSHDALFDQGHSPIWDTDNYQFNDIPNDWFKPESGLDVSPQNAPMNAVVSQMEQSYFKPQNVNHDPRVVLSNSPRLDSSQNVPLQMVQSPQVASDMNPGDQAIDSRAAIAGSDSSPAGRVHSRGVLTQQSPVRLDSQQSVTPDIALYIDIGIDVQAAPVRNLPVSRVHTQTERQEGGSAQLVQQVSRDGDGGSSGSQDQARLQVSVESQLSTPQTVTHARCLDSVPMVLADGVRLDANANANVVLVAPKGSVLCQQDAASALVRTLDLAVVAVALVLFSGMGLMAMARDAWVQTLGFHHSVLMQVLVFGALALGVLPEARSTSNVVFGSGLGLGSVLSVILDLCLGFGVTSSSLGCASMTSSVSAFTHTNARSSPLKSHGSRSGYDAAPSKLVLGRLHWQSTLVTVGLV